MRVQMGEIPMKIETRYISGRQADTKTVLFGKAMELPVCFYGEEGIAIIPPYEDRKKIETELEKAAAGNALAAGIALDMMFNEKGNYLKTTGGMAGPKTAEDLQYLQSFAGQVGIPFLVKGVLSQRDAYQCLKAGVSGIKTGMAEEKEYFAHGSVAGDPEGDSRGNTCPGGNGSCRYDGCIYCDSAWRRCSLQKTVSGRRQEGDSAFHAVRTALSHVRSRLQ